MKDYRDLKKPLKGPLTITPKLNGVNAEWTGTKLLSRNGHEITSCPHILNTLIDNRRPPGFGELFSPTLTFEEINGASRSKEPTDVSNQLRWYRFSGLPKTILEHDNSEILTCIMNDMVSIDYEGIVITAANGIEYKYKPIYDAEYHLIGFEPAKGERNKDTFGSLILGLPNGDTFKCSGITDKQRSELWTAKPIGVKIKIEYGTISRYGVPIFPRFICIRWDI